MPTLVTNVLVRYLVRDDPGQHAAAARFIDSASATTELFVPLTVALELEWELHSRYDVGKDAIVATLASLLETREIVFQGEPSVERALSLFDEGPADFADCLHLALALARDSVPLITFDRKAARMPETTLLEG